MKTVREIIEEGELYAAQRALRLAKIREVKARLALQYTRDCMRADEEGRGELQRPWPRLYEFRAWMV